MPESSAFAWPSELKPCLPPLHRLPGAALAEYDYYLDTHRLRISVSNMKNTNSRASLEHIKATVLANLSQLPPAPGAQFASRPPVHVRVRPDTTPGK